MLDADWGFTGVQPQPGQHHVWSSKQNLSRTCITKGIAMTGIEEFALGVIMSLVANALSSASGFSALSYFKRQKIRRRVEIATAEVVEPLLPFLSNEGVNFRNKLTQIF